MPRMFRNPAGPKLDLGPFLQRCLPGKLLISLLCPRFVPRAAREGRDGWAPARGDHFTPLNGVLFASVINSRGTGGAWTLCLLAMAGKQAGEGCVRAKVPGCICGNF